MMNKAYIEFKKQRDFGLLLSDTFGFLRNEFKPFIKTVFVISGPALMLFVIAMTFYVYYAGDAFDFNVYSIYGLSVKNPGMFMLTLVLYFLTFFVAIMYMSSSSLNYIKSYINNNGQVNIEEVKRNVHKTIIGYLGLGFLKWGTIFIAMLLCFLPVFYFMVPMFVALSIYVFDARSNATDSYSKSYSLVNEDFWISIGFILVIVILYYVLNFIFSLPAGIYSLIESGIFSGEIDPGDNPYQTSPILIFINVISTFFTIFLNLIPIVSGAFLYFHLNEKRNFTGTYERISNIGKIEE